MKTKGKNKALKKTDKYIHVQFTYVLAGCGSLKIAYLLLKSVWKAGQICSFVLQTV